VSGKDKPPAVLPRGARVGLNTDHAIAFLEKLQALCLEFDLAIDETEDLGLALVPLGVEDDDAEPPVSVYAFFTIGDDGTIEWTPACVEDDSPDDASFVVDVPS
jgi:hypothetical protein